ncbi:RNA polymerase sigma factor [Aquisalinus flavus]|uniref:RNA polymerase sigma factor n=1 Tax=Aquisalinus flavus TaxID=1526572 RepID=A0A8J2Y7X8_9PROT|nr:RNA polymerase sigma factor [Aquisalinus flavus]MBD0426304.1 RNA polymerase sigma factor [Aquisalinus flavus]UNE48128.1 RNA polymerase sigma factor [Aquisalinus flavus]GGD09006.1 RNA polymerase sigma factor [Aquisalinus flavus]
MSLEDPDIEDIRLLARGDAAAASRLVLRHSDRLMAVAYRMTGTRSAAEDIVQEAFIRMMRQAADWQEGKALFSTWLHRVTVNLCYDRLRKASTRYEQAAGDDLPEQMADDPGADAVLEARERGLAVRAALDRLPERQKMAIVLCHYEELSNHEAAEAMDISIEALESLLARARRLMRKDMKLAAALADG